MQLKKCRGFSIVELMVSMVAGLVVVAGAISLFTSVIVSGNTTLMLSRLNQDVQVITDMLARDIQRAGYHPSAAQDMASGTPSSSAKSTKYQFSTTADLYTASGATAPGCIRIKYWDPDPASGAGSVVRVYGYDTANKLLKVSTSYTEPGSGALGSGDCSGGSKLVSETEVQIDSLSFALVSGSGATGMRAIDLAISASHATRPALSMSLQRQVKLRNDGY
ncbi:type IV pilus assembly protein PilW [Oceanisphaera litoralis]|uniref:PilW family protein n=1 Tax=Oceanisphaera litoralis TaxID=225144 RepID=UPI00195A00D2|nr:prepilin-type N-terminal cleavage/methylation domain-containing protein [Oceanisphaera litoralis]MBM7456926.1 type IV pilus assembly protein PilW [Oceanisphaera litoralis]